mmetsp:Transcript_45520/g.142421  ORF Transcript_45520/g.142421 Transcript_45520/m.142421 type:complete len:220 (-) Transcript_45520:822-1481(-)
MQARRGRGPLASRWARARSSADGFSLKTSRPTASSPSGSRGSREVKRKKRDRLKEQQSRVGSSASSTFAPLPMRLAERAARPWKRARWQKRSVFSTLPSSLTRVEDSKATTLTPTTEANRRSCPLESKTTFAGGASGDARYSRSTAIRRPKSNASSRYASSPSFCSACRLSEDSSYVRRVLPVRKEKRRTLRSLAQTAKCSPSGETASARGRARAFATA